jgi:hypothetical protein
MICQPCRDDHHLRCRETARQNPALNQRLTSTELAGSTWCDCQHKTPYRKQRDGNGYKADVHAAAEAIEASTTFRQNFTPAHPLGRLHPAAVEFARLAALAEHRDEA